MPTPIPWHSRLRFVGVLAAFGLVTWLVFRDDVMGGVLVPLRTLTAEMTLGLIHVVGMEAVREATAIYSPGGFAIEISRGCTALVAIGLLTVAIWAYPAPRHLRAWGLGVCVPALIAINFTRLVHLFYLGVHQSAAFHVAHEVVWQGLMVVAVFGLWLGWVLWADRHRSVRRDSPPTPSMSVSVSQVG